MSNTSDNPFLRGSQRFYGWLLAAYPKRHRKEYGTAMQQVFRDQCRDVWNEARSWGLTLLWLRVLPDLFKTAFVERLSALQGDAMSNRFARILGFHSNLRVLFLRTALAVFVVVFGATAITTLLTPKRFTSEAQLLVRLTGDSRSEVAAVGKPLSAEALAEGDRIMAGEMQLIQSDAVLERVVKAQSLETQWTGASGQRHTTEEAVALLKSRLKVRVPSRSGLIEVRVNCEDADEAPQLAQAVLDAYLAAHIKAIHEGRAKNLDRAAIAEERRTERERWRGGVGVLNIKIVQSPSPVSMRPYVPGCLLMGGAGGLFLALTLGVAVTSLAKRRSPKQPDDAPTAGLGAAA